MLLLIGATTGFAKDEFELGIKESNFRFYTIEWIDENVEPRSIKVFSFIFLGYFRYVSQYNH